MSSQAGAARNNGVNAAQIRNAARAEFHSLSQRLQLSYYRLWWEKAVDTATHNAAVVHYPCAAKKFERR